jgi:endonuclease YncB( thermonuclease family)
LLVLAGQARAADIATGIAGAARAVDGDTLVIAGRQVCLHGIDAPEPGQQCQRQSAAWPCGRAATQALAGLVADEPVDCRAWTDLSGLLVATCRVGWRDLGAEMVNRGLAIAIEGESLDYLQNHREARARGVGIFAGEFVAPARWRRGDRHPIETAD